MFVSDPHSSQRSQPAAYARAYEDVYTGYAQGLLTAAKGRFADAARLARYGVLRTKFTDLRQGWWRGSCGCRLRRTLEKSERLTTKWPLRTPAELPLDIATVLTFGHRIRGNKDFSDPINIIWRTGYFVLKSFRRSSS
jgi:hypothetical protein